MSNRSVIKRVVEIPAGQRAKLHPRVLEILDGLEDLPMVVNWDRLSALADSFGTLFSLAWDGGWRSSAEQEVLYNKGRDSEGNIVDKSAVVTYARPRDSFHCWGLAFDLVPKGTKWNFDGQIFKDSGLVAYLESKGFRWGGNFTVFGPGGDKVHFELPIKPDDREPSPQWWNTPELLPESAADPVSQSLQDSVPFGLVAAVFLIVFGLAYFGTRR